MAHQTETRQTAPPPQSRSSKIVRFEPPAELPEHFGAQVVEQHFIQGVVPTEHVRELLDSFGLQRRNEVTFPFQNILRERGETVQLRIEPIAIHSVDGSPVSGHQWVYNATNQ